MKFSLPKLPEYSQRWLLLDLLGGIVGVIGEAATKNIMVVYPDETVHVAKDMIYENKIGRFPVVSRDNPKKWWASFRELILFMLKKLWIVDQKNNLIH